MKLLTTLLSSALVTGSLFFVTPVTASEHGMMHGKSGHHGMSDGRHGWKATLTEAQQQQLSKIKLDYKKKVLPIKAKIKQAKIDLALLITTDKPDQKAIDKKIDEISKLKAEKMRAKAQKRVAVRKILDDKQRVMFDLHVLKKASKGKKGCKHGYHH
jgi:Spy/CpxP family protein refolding chaperone